MRYNKEQKEKVIEDILEHISKGAPLRTVLKKEGFPSSRTFYRWLDSDAELVKRYAIATEERANNIFEDLLDIADDGKNDMILDENGKHVLNKEVIQRSRLRVDTRKWFLSKLQPKKYGDKMSSDVTVREQPFFPDED